MTPIRALAAVALAILITACASPAPTLGAAAPADNPMPGMSSMEPRMQAMHEMHQKMQNAKEPAEREALMGEHMEAMQGGMAMMKEMHGAEGMGGKPVPGEVSAHKRMMAEHMAMMQMMMAMMADRIPPAPADR
jgi:hypothetical protein